MQIALAAPLLKLESGGREDVRWCCWRCSSTMHPSVTVTLARELLYGVQANQARYASPSTKNAGPCAARMLRRAVDSG